MAPTAVVMAIRPIASKEDLLDGSENRALRPVFCERGEIGFQSVVELSMIKVLFVCMGNICRSPTAHGVFRDLVYREGLAGRIEIDSAGTHGYHVGAVPDQRAQRTALSRGFDLSDLRARQVKSGDFVRYDYLLAMDRDNYAGLRAICPPGSEHKLHLLMDFAPHWGPREVPDPYYGGQQGFDQVFDMVTVAAQGLLAHIRRIHSL